MRTLEYTLPDGSTGTATPDDVAKAVEALLMDGTMVMDSKELQVALEQARANEARHTAIVRAVVERAVERGVVTR
jgi:thiamine pyrophosphate-dependent acetolactate synthase large subunit-like protein